MVLVHQTEPDEHKIDVPFSRLSPRKTRFIALQRPSSVGTRPIKYLIERLSADSFTPTPADQSEQKMLTSQCVEPHIEQLQCRAEAEFRRNVACAARRSFLGVGTLVYQTGLDEHKMDVPVNLLFHS
jgi:hypothetical protein